MGDEPSEPLPAGRFGPWLASMRLALDGEGESDVPCGGCTACCESSQFVHVEADELDALAAIPAELLVPAPGATDGSSVLGYDSAGRCPMLVDGGCSIYAVRPRACRTYDCRVFAAAGVEPDQPLVAVRVRRWRFSYDADADAGADRAAHDAVLAASRSVAPRSRNATEQAVLAIRTSI